MNKYNRDVGTPFMNQQWFQNHNFVKSTRQGPFIVEGLYKQGLRPEKGLYEKAFKETDGYSFFTAKKHLIYGH